VDNAWDAPNIAASVKTVSRPNGRLPLRADMK
jgi:hypothetical protein